MKIGTLDLDTRFEYLIVYKQNGLINTWTLGIGFKNNYKAMMNDDSVEILGVYKKMNDSQLEDIITT